MVDTRSDAVKSGSGKKPGIPDGPFPTPTLVEARLSLLESLPELQCRTGGLDPKHVEALRQVIRDGDTSKLVIKVRRVLMSGIQRWFITDGNHTREAWNLQERELVPVLVQDGTWDDARLDATAANKEHQCTKYRSREDVRNAIRRTLLVKAEWSDVMIASHVGTTDKTVAKVRNEMERCGEISHTTHRTDTNGTIRPSTAPRPSSEIPRIKNEQPTSTVARDEWIEEPTAEHGQSAANKVYDQSRFKQQPQEGPRLYKPSGEMVSVVDARDHLVHARSLLQKIAESSHHAKLKQACEANGVPDELTIETDDSKHGTRLVADRATYLDLLIASLDDVMEAEANLLKHTHRRAS
jgi:hypothetical protein